MNEHRTREDLPNSRTGASVEAIASHYDMGNAFFQLVLDPQLVYSCALFADNDDLAAAQLRKLDHHIDAAGAHGASRVLDIGCGWGAMLDRLVGHANVGQAVGLTLSPAQAGWIAGKASPRIEVREEDWRDHKPAQPYDAIISIGAFEHFVHKGLSPEVRMQTYRAFFDRCAKLLRPGGRLSLQTIAYPEPTALHPYLEDAFPQSDLPLFWEPIAAAEGPFRLIALSNHADHYERTLQLWEQNLLANRAKAVALVGEAEVEAFRRYMRLSRLGFKHGYVGLLRMNFVKSS